MDTLALEGKPITIDSITINSFQNDFHGDLLQPGESAYEESRQIWNGIIDKRPALIARCEDRDDVITALNFARENEMLFSVHGGGHNVAGNALCDQGLVIDLSKLNNVEVNPQTKQVKAGGGTTIAQLDKATQAHDLAVPMGVVSKTGIAGLTLGGGIGWLRRKYGLSCDNMVSAEVVTADSRLLTASKTENTELFWGLKGGGGNFGIVTQFTFQAHPVGPEVMFIFALYNGRYIHDILRSYRDYCAAAPDEVTSFTICGDVPAEEDFPEDIHDEPYVMIAACYAGSVEEGRRIMQPLREFDEQNGGPMLDLSGPMSYADEVQTILDADYPDGMRYYWKSLFLDDLNDEVIDAVIAQNEKRPGKLSTVDLWHMGGAVAQVSDEESAFTGRQALYLLGVEANWENAENDRANIDWTRSAVTDMEQFSRGEEYLNFPGFLEGGHKTMQKTFGKNYQRLAKLKQKYDPQNIFRLNQNIKPSQS